MMNKPSSRSQYCSSYTSMRLSLHHLAAFSSTLPSQVVPSITAAFQLGCFTKDCFSALSEAGFVNGLLGMNTFPDALEPGTGPRERRRRPLVSLLWPLP